MRLLAIIGILAAVAIPAFLKYIRRSKTAEAPVNVRRIYDGALAYFDTEHNDSMGQPQQRTFPSTTPVTGNGASTNCCSGGKAKCLADATLWTGSWAELNFVLADSHYYVYQFIRPSTTVFTAAATGDLDCNGTEASFFRDGIVQDGTPIGFALKVINETE